MSNQYASAQIYAIRSHQSDDVYIGSTTLPLAQCLSSHRSAMNALLNGKSRKCVSSWDVVRLDDAYIELLESWPCTSKRELSERQGYHIRNHPNCINRVIPGRTSKQYYADQAAAKAKRRAANCI